MTTDNSPFVCECSNRDCSNQFTADSIISLAKKVTRHWTREHGGSLSGSYDAFDSEEIGGHHIQDDYYQVRRRHYYITVYDVLATGRKRPISEEFATRPEVDHCAKCWKRLYESDERIEAGSGIYGQEYHCTDCEKEAEIQEKSESNRSLSEFGFAEGDD